MDLSISWICPGSEGPDDSIWCMYNSFKILVTTASMLGAATVGMMIYRKRRRLNELDPRRKKTLSNFIDVLVSDLPNGCAWIDREGRREGAITCVFLRRHTYDGTLIDLTTPIVSLHPWTKHMFTIPYLTYFSLLLYKGLNALYH